MHDEGSVREKHYKDSESFSVSSAGKPHSSRAATASATTNFSTSPETMTVLAFGSISRFATPGSDCKVDLTVARHPPQCISGQENLTRATELTAFAGGESDFGAEPKSVSGAAAVGADAG